MHRFIHAFAILAALGVNAAYADTNAAVDKLMGDAILQSQKMVLLMTDSCSGGPHGQNPNHYPEFVGASNEIGKTLGDLRVAFGKGQIQNAAAQIDAVEGNLERMTALMAGQCPGGAHGLDPLHFGDIINIKQRMLGSLDAVKVILAS